MSLSFLADRNWPSAQPTVNCVPDVFIVLQLEKKKKIVLNVIPATLFLCVDIVMWTMLVWTFSILIFSSIVIVMDIVIVSVVNSPLNFITLKTSEPFISLDWCSKERGF